jgi:uncharacterized protein YxjI
MQCPSCGNAVADNVRFCPSCGTKIEMEEKSAVLGTGVGSVFAGTEYIVEQKIVALRDTFGIKNRNGNLLAYVKKKIVSWGPHFFFETPDGTRLGEMRGKVLSVRPTFEIYDDQGLIAVVKKKILKLLGSEWWLENSSGEIARIKGNITEHNFSIQSPTGTEIAQISKKWVSVRDSYSIEVLSQELSPYVIIAYAIAMDHAEFKARKGFAMGLAGIGAMTDDFKPQF